MFLWISYYVPTILHSWYCIQQWTNIDQDPAMFQCGNIMSFQLVKSRREEGLLKSPKAFFPFFPNPPWVNSVYAMFHSCWWTKVPFPLKCRAGKSLKRHLIFSSPSPNPGNETTSSICTPCFSVLKNLQWQIQKGSLAYQFQYLTVFTVKRIFLIFDLYLSYKLSWLLHQYQQQATTILFYSSLLHIDWPELELIERSALVWFKQKTDQMITTVPSGFVSVWIKYVSWAKISSHSAFFLETNTVVFHLTEISHSFLHSHIPGTFPLYLQKIANLFSVWMTSNKIKLYCTVLGHTWELEFVCCQFLCFSLS